jgi:two-component system nitrogen regulation sensor histidine kinase NtrY
MIHKNFRVSLLLRVLLITSLALSLAYVTIREPTFFAPLAMVLALIAAVINLILYIEKSTRDLSHFLLSLRQRAFTESYPSGNRGKLQEELSGAFREIVREFASLNAEKELHYQYLEALNENISVAILSFDADGKLLMLNPAAKRLLNLPSFSSIEHFKRIDPVLFERVRTIVPEERHVVKVFISEDQYQLSVQVKEIILQGKPIRIILLQNLNSELEAKEIEAWYQLIRVLTHEIMNSVTPIVSLTAAMRTILNHPDGTRKELTKLTDENMEDVFSSLTTIESRSKGLLRFVNAYKEYAKPMELHVESVDVIALIKRIVALVTPDLHQYKIRIDVISSHASLPIKADVSLMEQVLLNLIRNAIDAVTHDGNGVITIGAKLNRNNLVSITVADNGTGMDEDTVSRIFIPFFTTKAKGTGIGLSLSRQIMKLHNGNIRVSTTPEKGSSFTIEWK